jgi:hypothetical protein
MQPNVAPHDSTNVAWRDATDRCIARETLSQRAALSSTLHNDQELT